MYILFGLIILLILLLIYNVIKNVNIEKNKENFSDGENGGTITNPSDLVPSLMESQQRFNKLGTLINTANPQLPLTSTSSTAIDRATITPTIYGGLPGEYQVSIPSPQRNPYKIPENQSATMKLTQVTCEKIKTPDCSAFNNATFAENCGISFDPNGTDSTGNYHMGGLYISPDDKQAQEQMQKQQNLTPDQIQYVPSIGKASKGMFAVDATTCNIIKEQLECKRTKSFNSPNCTQCLTSSDFVRVDPSIPRIPPTLVMQTNAESLSIILSNGSTVSIQIPAIDTGFTLPDISLNEGDIFYISATGSAVNLYISGYISGQTVNGTFNMDINGLIDEDLVTGYKQRLGGAQTVSVNGSSGIQCMIIRAGMGESSMKLRGHIPFTFLSPYEYDATYCNNGPFLTMQSSADFLSSDVCYGPKNGPGAYQLDCLQQMFLSLGGTTAGGGYPQSLTSNSAKQLLFDSTGKARELGDISNYIYNIAIRASTGRDSNGNDLSVSDWNTASMYITGTPITSPCGAGSSSDPITKECIQYLYDGAIPNTPGASRSSVMPTYSLGPQYASKDANGNPVYCTSKGRLSPSTSDGLSKAMAIGNIQGIQQMYDNAHKMANDNTKTNEERQGAMMDCYGEIIQPKMPEVYYTGNIKDPMNNYMYTIGDGETAEQVCGSMGGRVATMEEVSEAQKAGAQWCATGIVSDNNYGTAVYPMQDVVKFGCGGPGLNTFVPESGKAGINCYGPKPDQVLSSSANVLPFTGPVPNVPVLNQSPLTTQVLWNQPY